jgi:ribosomal protein S18 acetylase RimI-like enzyme
VDRFREGNMNIGLATMVDLDAVAPLFDAYRQFYHCPPDLPLARRFLTERLQGGDSTIFLARDESGALGFVQLYPLFTSSSPVPGRLWLLNDLFVAPAARGRGAGRALLERARRYAEETGARGLFLQTARDNLTAQRLYESLGWQRDDLFLVYELALP